MSLKYRKKYLQAVYNHYVEDYENLKLNIELLAYELKCKSLYFTSPGKNEGKTTTVAHLAVSLAKDGHNVLIIDTNIRKPKLHKLFKIKNVIGLTNILIGQKTYKETINQTDMERLKVITSGPTPYNIEKLYSSTHFDHLLEQLSKQFDYILIDGTPVLEQGEARIISSKCDAVLLVVRDGKSEDVAVVETKKVLDISKANTIGVIFNGKKLGVLNFLLRIFAPGRSVSRTSL